MQRRARATKAAHCVMVTCDKEASTWSRAKHTYATVGYAELPYDNISTPCAPATLHRAWPTTHNRLPAVASNKANSNAGSTYGSRTLIGVSTPWAKTVNQGVSPDIPVPKGVNGLEIAYRGFHTVWRGLVNRGVSAGTPAPHGC